MGDRGNRAGLAGRGRDQGRLAERIRDGLSYGRNGSQEYEAVRVRQDLFERAVSACVHGP